MTFTQDNFYIVTGGPGSGKTTLISALRLEGLPHSIEAGRAIIQDQVSIGGTALPWADRSLFAELMLQWEMRSYAEAKTLNGPVIFDRGVPDVIGYLTLCELPVPAHIRKAAEQFRYNKTVFIAPPWREIFAHDTERKQDFAEAERTYAAMEETYRILGYELIVLPKTSVENRTRIVLDQIRLKPAHCSSQD